MHTNIYKNRINIHVNTHTKAGMSRMNEEMIEQ